MPTRTHYYDGGTPLCGLKAVCWNWSLEPRAVSCAECSSLLRQRLVTPVVVVERAPAPRASGSDTEV
jgi:hypothetical protein